MKNKFKFRLETNAMKLADALKKAYQKNHIITKEDGLFTVEVRDCRLEFAQGFVAALRSVGCEI